MTTSFCPDCGQALPVQAPGGLCPACLLGLARRKPETAHSSPALERDACTGNEEDAGASPDRVGRYKLLEIIGEGGFGTVWMAEQQEPVRRKVALKVIKLGMDTQQVVARFEAERQALALMDHPSIARVFDAGATETGRPFFVMEMVRGLPITEYCESRELNTRAQLELFIPICQAVQHAHQKGVIHRDLKPSNILVTEQDGRAIPKIIDFGVAKAIEDPLIDKTLFTRFHQFLGTPAYMSPEQAGLGVLDIDTRSDIYSLGVLLYELLTGHPPLDPRQLREAGYESILKRIRETDPPKPSTQLRRRLSADRLSDSARAHVAHRTTQVDQDLDWIVLKALEKDRARRYESANELAADLRRYLDNEAIAARPPSTWYRLQKLARRNRLVFGAAGAVAAALVVGLISTSWQAWRATRHLAQARLNAYVSDINVAQQALAENNLERARELLERQRPGRNESDLRGFEWRYLWQLCQSDEAVVFTDESANTSDFSRDGRWLAYGGLGKVIVRETASQQLIATLKTSVESLSFSPDSRLLATAGRTNALVWDTRTWSILRELPEASDAALFSPDGKWLVTGQTDGERLVLWDCATWSRVADCPATPDIKNHMRNALAFSPDSRQLTTLWVEFARELPSGLRFWKIPSLEPAGDLFSARMPLACAAFDPDGKHLLTGTWDGQLLVWDVTGRKPKLVAQSREHSTHIMRIAIASNGKIAATAGEDQTLNLWERGSWQHLARLRGHTNQIWALAISPDGGAVASGSGIDGVTRLWRTDQASATDLLDVGSLIAGFTADGGAVVLGPHQGDYRWRMAGVISKSIAVATNATHQEDLRHKPFDVHGARPLGVLGRQNGLVEVWDLGAGAQIAAWRAETNEITFATFSPDGRHIATGSATGTVRVWDATTGAKVAAFQPSPQGVTALAFSPDGHTLAAACDWAPIFFWDVVSLRSLPALPFQKGACWLGFSPDSHTLAVANLAGAVRLFELTSARVLAELKGHVMGVLRAEFFMDGKTLATGSLDGKVKLWNLATHQELLTLSVPLGGTFHSLSIAPDGRTLSVGYLGSPGRHVQLFRAPSFDEITARERDRRK